MNLAEKEPVKLQSMMKGLINQLASMHALYPVDTEQKSLILLIESLILYIELL